MARESQRERILYTWIKESQGDLQLPGENNSFIL